ncbi:acetyl esterase [Limihaloglobus sulfuriphilus]|uniref:Acetyl esterase n=1 Tax=Limihaloglobus sulfuriphilus TaxID=1851148 RepID=A0A1Q2MH98_9BACT|nr:prolyl oligopeptidase family serine peptidase [Limihaloglobus sulfuriphilus]AQQ71908.1 acetyl esterase [Limihaloglobus sulfuriphilus]
MSKKFIKAFIVSAVIASLFCTGGCRDGVSPAGDSKTEKAESPAQITTKELVYKRLEGKELACEVDMPAGVGPFPVVLYVHSWGGSLNQLKGYSQRMARRGIAGVRINYRRLSEGTEFADAKSDVEAAIDFIRGSSDEMNFDMSRFGMAGASAGAVLSSLICQYTPECKVFVAFNGGFDLLNKCESKFPGEQAAESMFPGVTEEKLRAASSIYNLRNNPPASLLFHGSADETISSEQARRFAEAVKNKGGSARLELYEGRKHGFFNSNMPDFENIAGKLESFLVEEFDL